MAPCHYPTTTDGVVNKILKFADDTKIVSKVASDDQRRVFLRDLTVSG